jgi:hypothetical protein
MGKKKRKWTELGLCSLLFVLGGVLLEFKPASATDSGPTVTGDVCMQQVYGGSNVTNSNRLNCTANDISIAKATNAINAATGEASCVAGTTFDLVGTFQVNVTANERYDAAFFFNIAGGTDARNPNGTCSQSVLTNGVAPALGLDKDTCGDLNAGTYTNITFTIPNVLCQDSDGDGFLNLPNCTSWHSNAGTVCSVTAAGISGAAPETKSKCNCDDTFQVPVSVESPTGAVLKKATEAIVTYEIKVKNNSSTRTVKINSLIDDQYGDITKDKNSGNTAIETSDCGDLVGDTLMPAATSDACEFTVRYPHPGTGGDVVDKVTAEIQDTGNNSTVNVDGSTAINVDLNVAPPSP